MTAWYLTWLWQGTALALATAVILRIAPKLNAATRYWIWWGAFGGVISLGAHAWWADAALAQAGPRSVSLDEPLLVVPAAPVAWLGIVLGVWAGVALVRLVRILAAVEAIWSLRARCASMSDEVEAQLPLWSIVRRQGRPSQLVLCDDVAGPTLLGFGRPYVALPLAMVKTLKPDQLDAIVLHEHAHAQRHDDWLTLLQALLQAIFWIHPAMAAIGRALNFERELACDERVVAQTANPKDYARCLTRAAEIRSAKHQTALGSTLFGAAGQLARRVDRLLAMTGGSRPSVSRLAVVGGCCVIAVAVVQLRALPAVAEIGEVMTPAVALASRLAVGAGAVPVEASAAATAQPSIARRPSSDPSHGVSLTSTTPVSSTFTEASEPNSAAVVFEEVPTTTMADLAHAAFHEIEPSRDGTLTSVRSPEPTRDEETAQRGPFWRRFERAGVGLGGAFTNFGQSIARRF